MSNARKVLRADQDTAMLALTVLDGRGRMHLSVVITRQRFDGSMETILLVHRRSKLTLGGGLVPRASKCRIDIATHMCYRMHQGSQIRHPIEMPVATHVPLCLTVGFHQSQTCFLGALQQAVIGPGGRLCIAVLVCDRGHRISKPLAQYTAICSTQSMFNLHHAMAAAY